MACDYSTEGELLRASLEVGGEQRLIVAEQATGQAGGNDFTFYLFCIFFISVYDSFDATRIINSDFE